MDSTTDTKQPNNQTTKQPNNQTTKHFFLGFLVLMMLFLAWGVGGFSGQPRHAQAWESGAGWLLTPTPEPTPEVGSPAPLSGGAGQSAWPELDPDCTDHRCVFAVQANHQDVSKSPGTCAYATTPSPEIYLGQCAQGGRITAGFLMTDVNLPQGAVISQAYLVFNGDGPYTQTLQLRIYGQASANSFPFYPIHPDPDLGEPEGRPLTQAQVPWIITETWVHQPVGHAPYASPNVAAIVQEIVSYGDWVTGNSMAFIVRDESPAGARYHRRVYAYERQGLTKSARLVVELASPPPPLPGVSIAVTDAQGDDVTALALNEEGWPMLNAETGEVANPLTVTVTVDAQDVPFPTMFELEMAGYQWQSRFYPVPDTLLCQTSVTMNSYRAWGDNCLVPPASVWTATWQIWVQPSSADMLKFSVAYSGGVVEKQVSVPTAKIFPVVFLPGLGATNPPAYAPMPYANRISVDGLLALGSNYGRYADFYNALERLGYERDKTYFLFPYDWLKDVNYSAEILRDELLIPAAEQVARTIPYVVGYQSSFGQDIKFDLIGHSTGNLVARAYMQSDETVWRGYVRRFVSLAGPHKGLPKSYVLLDGVDVESNSDTIAHLALFYSRIRAWFAGYRTWGPESRYLYVHDPIQGPTSIAGFLPTYTEMPYLTSTTAFPYGRYANPLFENAPAFDVADVTDGRYDPYFHNPYSAANLKGRYSPELLRQTFEQMYHGLNTPESMSLLYNRIGYGRSNNVCLIYAGEKDLIVGQNRDGTYDTRVQLNIEKPDGAGAPFWWLGKPKENWYSTGDRLVPHVSGGATDIWAGAVITTDLDERILIAGYTADHGKLAGYGVTHQSIAQCLIGADPGFLGSTPSGDVVTPEQTTPFEARTVLTPSRMLAIMAVGPVKFQLTDGEGRRLGDNGAAPLVAWPAIPWGSYIEEEKGGVHMAVPYPLANTYTLTVYGVSDGEFSLLVLYGDNTGQAEILVLDRETIQAWQTRVFGFVAPAQAGDVPQAPEVLAGWDYGAIAGETVGFRGYAADVNLGDELNYTWLFGDGQVQSGILNPQHMYVVPGVYTATLMVTDTTGLATADTVQVFVEP